MLWSSKMESRLYFTTLLKEKVASQKEIYQKELKQELVPFLKSQSGIWGAYKSMVWEADVEEAIQTSAHIQWVFPRIQGNELQFFKAQKFEKSPLGFFEPVLSGAQSVSLHEMNGLLVPGLAFNEWGVRLGRGKGFYDRALYGYKGLKVGVSFSVQMWNGELPVETHDVNMDCIITDKKVYWCGQSIKDRKVVR